MNRTSEHKSALVFKEKIIDEIFYALGCSRRGLPRRWLGPVFRLPARRFGEIAADADSEARRSGITGSARRILPSLSLKPQARGTENIPTDGPLLLAANHPGAYDSVAILSCIPRKDLKVLISDVAFSRAFSFASRYFIYVSNSAAGRLSALRNSIDHLRSGGSLLIFAHGDVEPDPELNPGSREAIADWSGSLEIMLRRVPETRLLVTIASGVLLPQFQKNPIVRLRKTTPRRQKLAEVLQICWQMLWPRSLETHVHISFAEPVEGMDFADAGIMPGVMGIARRLLEDHLSSLGRKSGCTSEDSL